MDTREANPGDLGGPVINGLELRDAVYGTIKVRDIDEAKREVDVEFPHEVIDSYKTKFGTRAFKESFDQRLPVMCWQHDLRDPIGRSLSAVVTPKTNDIVGKFSDFQAVPNAYRAFSQIDDGTITDFSFGFKNASYEPGGQRGVRRITKAFMAEFSPVTIGSIPGAHAVGLREDGNEMDEESYDLNSLLQMRKSGLITVKGLEALIQVHHPALAEKINVRDLTGDDNDADDPSGSAAMNMVDGPKWDATAAGLHTATGPNKEAMMARATSDGNAVYSVTGEDGTSIGTGQAEDIPTAKAAAEKLVNRSEDTFEIPKDEVNADTIRAAIVHYNPELASILEGVGIELVDNDGNRSAEGELDEFTTSLTVSFRAALESGIEYFDDTDIATLPEGVQEGIALIRAAGVAVEGLTDALGVTYEVPNLEEDPENDYRMDDEDIEERAASAGASTKPWGDFKASDYSDEQYKNAALIKGKDKSDSKLPVKEPDGTLNVHGLAAAASRLDSTDAPAADKKAAAKAIMSHYGKLGKKVPPSVLKHASGGGNREDEGPSEDELRAQQAEDRRVAAMAKLDRMTATSEEPAA